MTNQIWNKESEVYYLPICKHSEISDFVNRIVPYFRGARVRHVDHRPEVFNAFVESFTDGPKEILKGMYGLRKVFCSQTIEKRIEKAFNIPKGKAILKGEKKLIDCAEGFMGDLRTYDKLVGVVVGAEDRSTKISDHLDVYFLNPRKYYEFVKDPKIIQNRNPCKEDTIFKISFTPDDLGNKTVKFTTEKFDYLWYLNSGVDRKYFLNKNKKAVYLSVNDELTCALENVCGGVKNEFG